ncbi:hypothetical protein ABFY59_09505 [Priestia aryabhattai]|uniref:hypothetical protein n=1 Tax=Priestia aryabhattai TaxID=412384 RepID=UPI003D28E1A1
MLGETFTLFRPVYYLITIFLVCNFVYVVFLSNKIKANSYILFNSFFFVIIGAMLLFQQGIIVDEANLAGDPVIFILTILFGILFIASFIFQNTKKRKA